jgi:hypothetical protein
MEIVIGTGTVEVPISNFPSRLHTPPPPRPLPDFIHLTLCFPAYMLKCGTASVQPALQSSTPSPASPTLKFLLHPPPRVPVQGATTRKCDISDSIPLMHVFSPDRSASLDRDRDRGHRSFSFSR